MLALPGPSGGRARHARRDVVVGERWADSVHSEPNFCERPQRWVRVFHCSAARAGGAGPGGWGGCREHKGGRGAELGSVRSGGLAEPRDFHVVSAEPGSRGGAR